MVVRDVVSDLERGNPDWTRPDLLYVLNMCYKILMNNPSVFTQARDSEGKDPEITPTTNLYTISDAFQIYAAYSGSARVGEVRGNTITFPNSALNQTYRVKYYKEVADLLVESQSFDFPIEYKDILIGICNEWIAYNEHKLLAEWLNAKKVITKDFWYSMGKYYSPSTLNDSEVMFRQGYTTRNSYNRFR